MTLEEHLREIRKDLDNMIRENIDVDENTWFHCLQEARSNIDLALQHLNMTEGD